MDDLSDGFVIKERSHTLMKTNVNIIMVLKVNAGEVLSTA